MIKKPICFSYRQYVELREEYQRLLEENESLKKTLKNIRNTAEVRLRKVEADKERNVDER